MNEDHEKRIEALESQMRNFFKSGLVADHRHNGFDATRVSIDDLDNTVYGHMYNNTSTAVTVSVQNTWYEVTSNFVTGVLKGGLFAGSHYIQVGQNGVYVIVFSMAIATATANQTIAGTVMVNGTATELSHGHSTVVSANSASSSVGTVILNLSAGDQISLAVENHSGAADITVGHANISIVRIG